MVKKATLAAALVVGLAASLPAQAPRQVPVGDWPETRGPGRDGTSLETELPDTWALDGENFLWRAPFGGRSTPVVHGDRVYVQNPSGRGAELRERVMALDADTGEVIWEYTFNLFQSDVPTHRVGWASPAVDLETGNVYALSGGAQVFALSPDGELLWSRSWNEEFAAFTTHGGRTMSPVVDGDLVIVSAAVSNWGDNALRRHRLIAHDKRTGEVVWVSAPGTRPFDTAFAPPLITTIGGTRMLITGLGNGGVHAIQPKTGEWIWSFPAARRAINTGVAVVGDRVLMSHGDENLEGTELGLIAAIDGSQTGDIDQMLWETRGLEFGFSSPVADGDRLYQIDSGGTLHAFATGTGEALWTEPLGNSQRAPLVLADGKLYVGTPGGAFWIIRPGASGAEVLSTVVLPDSVDSCCGSEGTPEQIVAGAAVSRGRVFFVSSDAVYAIGSPQPTAPAGLAVDEPVVTPGEPAHLQVRPTELVLEPGDSVGLRARLFDADGTFIREEPAEWSLDGPTGTLDGSTFVAGGTSESAGVIRASAAGLTGEARARVVHPLPWTEDFSSYEDGAVPAGWVNTVAGQLAVTTLDGEKVLQKAPLDTLFKRARTFIGPTDWSDYTFEADVLAPTRRRQMADVGITVQRYSLILRGTLQQLQIVPWEPETARSMVMPFTWAPDTWHRLKLRVDNLPGGQVQVRGKAWAVGEPEPAEWLIERTDPIGNREGAPGMFIDAQFGVYLDNFSLTRNE